MDAWRDLPTGVANREKWATFDPHDPNYVARWDVIERIRDRVVANAAFAPGQRVLDVGAGVGLIALEARIPLGPAGRVVALDLSLGALRTCRQRALAGPSGAAVLPVVGDALALPLRDEAFDVVVARSVFIYLADRAAAARECCRVLRPGGRAAIFEPINRHGAARRWYDSFADAEFEPAHGQIVALLRQQERNADWAVMRSFDERDLVRCFEEAGFTEVVLDYRYRSSNHRDPEILPGADFLARTPSYGEAAHAILGNTADAYLSRLAQVPVRHRQSGTSAEAYITATR